MAAPADARRPSGAGASCSVSPAGSPRTRRSRSAAAWSTPARTSRPSSPRTRLRFVGALTFSALGVGAGAHVAVRRPRADPAHPPRPDRRPRRRRAGHREAARQVRGRHLRRPRSPPRCSRPGRRCSSRRRCTPRCGSTPRCRRTWPRCARRGVHVVDPSRAASPAATSAPAAWPTRADRRGRGRERARRGAGDLAGRAGPGHRGRHPRADRPGALHRQPLVGEDGLRDRRGRRRAGAPPSRWSPPSAAPGAAGVEIVPVETAEEMTDAVLAASPAPTWS